MGKENKKKKTRNMPNVRNLKTHFTSLHPKTLLKSEIFWTNTSQAMHPKQYLKKN